MFRFLRDKNFLKILFIAILITLAYSFLLGKLNAVTIAKLKFIDLFSNISRQIKPLYKNADKIVIVAIDERSFKALNKRWPWDRAIFGEAIDQIQSYKPKLICFDFSFMGESQNKAEDFSLAQSMRNSANVIVASHFDARGQYITPDAGISDAALAYGFVNKPRDNDYYVRRARLFYFSRDGKIIDLSFELKTICKYLDIELKEILYNPRDGVIRLPKASDRRNYIDFSIRSDGTIPINYRMRFQDFETIPFWQALREDLPKDTFNDKIVLIGLTGEVSHDTYNTPMGILPGAAIVANSLLMYLNNDFIKELPAKINLLILLFFVIIIVFATYRLNAAKGLIFIIFAIASFTGLSIYLSLHNYWADYFGVILLSSLFYLGITAYKYIQLMIESVHLKTLAITDGMTGLYVHRYFQIRLQNEFERVTRYKLNLSLIMIDIDHFKAINDTYGHQQGDFILKSLAKIMLELSRKIDIVARYGGEEFCIVLPHTSQDGALIYAERLRNTVESSDFKIASSSKNMKVTISLGIAGLDETKAQSPEELIKLADSALYQAKETGRNKSCTANTKTS
ncbi:MAG: diguanylate cyclase [Candidatus Omnitrophica bacterium]|nr:diguanylate cyclase [Candidatus Omnitrophota bacterium]